MKAKAESEHLSLISKVQQQERGSQDVCLFEISIIIELYIVSKIYIFRSFSEYIAAGH